MDFCYKTFLLKQQDFPWVCDLLTVTNVHFDSEQQRFTLVTVTPPPSFQQTPWPGWKPGGVVMNAACVWESTGEGHSPESVCVCVCQLSSQLVWGYPPTAGGGVGRSSTDGPVSVCLLKQTSVWSVIDLCFKHLDIFNSVFAAGRPTV